MAAVMQNTARASRVIPAPVAMVFRAWTDPDLLGRWFAPGDMRCTVHELELKVGGRYRIEMKGETAHTAFGEYLEIVPDKRIVMTWAWENGNEDGGDAAGSILTAEFDDIDGRSTEVRITHEQLPSAKSAEEHQGGWTGCLENLATRVESF
jgi:uncharacterized protein YndB with AHSA1/START domain